MESVNKILSTEMAPIIQSAQSISGASPLARRRPTQRFYVAPKSSLQLDQNFRKNSQQSLHSFKRNNSQVRQRSTSGRWPQLQRSNSCSNFNNNGLHSGISANQRSSSIKARLRVKRINETGNVNSPRGRITKRRNSNLYKNKENLNATAKNGSALRGRNGRRSHRARQNADKQTSITKEQLDRELEEYMSIPRLLGNSMLLSGTI